MVMKWLQISLQPNQQQETKLTHIVSNKETLYSIARKYDVNVEQLKNWNNLEKMISATGRNWLFKKIKMSVIQVHDKLFKPYISARQIAGKIKEIANNLSGLC